MINRRSFLLGGVGAVAVAGLPGAERVLAATPRTSASGSGPDWGALSSRLSGSLVLPTDSAYPTAKQIFWGMYDSVEPQAIAYCRSTADAAACVRFARANGIQAIPRSGGHSFAGYSTGTGLIVDMSQTNDVRVGSSTVTVGGGAALVDVTAQLSPLGIAVPGGSHPSVCVGGFIQGGGSGWLTRTAGMACDRVVSAEVVLADGSVVTASARQNPELFWALRGGGGGNFGIVTRFELEPVPVTNMINFTYQWPWESAAALWTAWQEWALQLPAEISSALNVLLADAAPGNEPAVYAIGTSLGSSDELTAQLNALVAAVGSQPASAYVTPLSYQDAMMSWFRCSNLTVPECHRVGTGTVAEIPREPYSLNRNRMVTEPVPPSGVQTLLDAFDAARVAGHLRVVSYTILGGAANAPDRRATAYVHRDTNFLLDFATELFTSTPGAADLAAARSWIDNGFAVMDPVSNGESYQNFIDPALDDWQQAYYAENYPALLAVKRCYDPENYFSFAQSIGA